MSAEMWVGPISRCTNLMALNTGRSGQPVQNAGGRAGNSPRAAATLGRWPTMPRTRATIASASRLERAQRGIAEPAHDHNADLVKIARNKLVQLALADDGPRGRHAVLDLEAFVDERHGRMGQAGIIEARRAG